MNDVILINILTPIFLIIYESSASTKDGLACANVNFFSQLIEMRNENYHFFPWKIQSSPHLANTSAYYELCCII